MIKSLVFPPTRLRAWLQVCILTTLIFSTLSIVRPIVTFLKETGCLNWAVGAGLAGFLMFYGYIAKQFNLHNPRQYVALSILAGIYAVCLIKLVVAPEERIHFAEYGILCFTVFHALSFDIRKQWLHYGLCFLIVGLIGYADEAVQYVLPNRVYDIRDVGLNILSAILMLLFLKISRFK